MLVEEVAIPLVEGTLVPGALSHTETFGLTWDIFESVYSMGDKKETIHSLAGEVARLGMFGET